ncbi:MAG: glycosyltransferase [Candidatus Omnitrophota bacterium]
MYKNDTFPSVSIIVSSKDRRLDLNKAIDSLKNLDYPKDRFEIIVVEEGDSPQRIEGVKYIFIPRKDKIDYSYPRNLAIKDAEGEIIAFVDDDCIVVKDWLKELVSCFKEGIGGVAGGVFVKDCNSIGYCETVLGFTGGGLQKIVESKGNIIPTTKLSTCNCAYRKEVLQKLGCFKPSSKYSGEDFDLAKRVCDSYKCLYNPNALAYHKTKSNLLKIFKWFIRRGVCEIYLVKMKTNKFTTYLWYNITRSIIIRFVLVVLLLVSIKKNTPYVYIGIYLIYYLLIFIRYSFQWERIKNIKSLFLTPIVKLIMDIGMDCGRIAGPFILLREPLKKER